MRAERDQGRPAICPFESKYSGANFSLKSWQQHDHNGPNVRRGTLTSQSPNSLYSRIGL